MLVKEREEPHGFLLDEVLRWLDDSIHVEDSSAGQVSKPDKFSVFMQLMDESTQEINGHTTRNLQMTI